MSCRRQNRCTAERLVRIPCVFFRWSASSAWVQLARSSTCVAGPSITQRRISPARCWDRRGLPLCLAGRQAVEAPFEGGVEPPLDGPGSDAQVGGDCLMGSASMGQPDDLEAVVEFAVGRQEAGPFEAAGLPVEEVDSDHEGEESLGASVGLLSLRTKRPRRPDEPKRISGFVYERKICAFVKKYRNASTFY